MKTTQILPIVLCFCFGLLQCSGRTSTPKQQDSNATSVPEGSSGIADAKLVLGAAQLDLLLPQLANKKVALVVNNTSTIGKTHLADTLLARGVSIAKIFAPEHGFRGTADAGEHVKDGVDLKTGLKLVSLYGSNRKPTAEQLADVDILIFDIQDVGVRFYTYISTLQYLMEACAEQNKKLIVLDRPNPNGNFVDGPVLEPKFRSFLGMHTIPLVHGLTVGELAGMINGEGWLGEGKKCDVAVIKMQNWKHADEYSLPAKPSPNLPNDQAIRLYPSLGLFEGTVISVGRGTQMPFQIIGHPLLTNMPFQFTPVSIEGMAKNPPYENQVCYGLDLRNVKVERKLSLQYLLDFYKAFPDKAKFFNNSSFDTHLGTSTLREQITAGWTEEAIRNSWKDGLDKYNLVRNKYLLYQ
jgi:uncharacterized protein YbbC (DUF1343 family)